MKIFNRWEMVFGCALSFLSGAFVQEFSEIGTQLEGLIGCISGLLFSIVFFYALVKGENGVFKD